MNNSDRQITIRLLDEADAPSLRRLAQLDSAGVPAAPQLGAELGGELVAAISLREPTGSAIANPFVATTAATELLALRAAQLRGGKRRWNGRLGQLRDLPRARGALAGSQPGGGARLLQL